MSSAWACCYTARDLLDYLLFRLGYFRLPDTSPRYYVVTGRAQIFAGLYLLRGAPQIVRLAFADARDDEDDEINDEEEDEPPASETNDLALPDAR